MSSSVALVTGGGRGIGRSIAQVLGEAGFTVGVLSRTRADVHETCALLESRGQSAVPLVGDVTSDESVTRAVADLEEIAGAIDLLVNNAGTLRALGPLWEASPGDWWVDIETNLGGTYRCCRRVVPGMLERGRGRIVNLVSRAAVRPAPRETAYAAAKAAVLSLTEGLAAACAERGVKVFAVSPGFTRTAMTDALVAYEESTRGTEDTPPRKALDPVATADLVAWLAGGAGDVLSGRCVHTLDDPGEMARRIDEVRRGELYVPRLGSLPPGSG
jgi:NAD(P)-dependent dehydrogenase (short-subunit alcohol dehydrogenase family)